MEMEWKQADRENTTDTRNEEADNNTAAQADTPKQRRTKKTITIDAAFAKRFIEAEKILSTEAGISLVQSITDSKSNSVPTLMAELTRTKNRTRVEKLNTTLSKLKNANQLTVGIILADLFGRDAEMRVMVFRVLAVLAPDINFGKSTGDNTRDALAISEKWNDNIDVTQFSQLIL